MDTIEWIYPKSVDELISGLKHGATPVGGGTGILRNVPKRGTFADLSGVGLNGAEVTAGKAKLGAMVTYAGAVDAVGAENPENIVAKALATVAAPALRNIITLGGSLALFPPWSRLVGPLVALDATVTTVGSRAGTYPVAEYVNSVELKEKSAITHVEFLVDGEWESHWFPFAPVRFNYPLLTVAVLVKTDGSSINDCRVVVTGNRGRFARLEAVETAVRGRDRPGVSVGAPDLGTDIVGRQGFTGEYLGHLTATYVTRGLRGSQRSAA